MKKLLIFIILVVAAVLWLKGFVQSGGFEKYLDAHPNTKVNPAVEYYWGMALSFASHRESAVYRLSKVTEKYPKSEYAPLAWIERIQVLDDIGNRRRLLEEARKFLESPYATHPGAETIRKKLDFYEHGM